MKTIFNCDTIIDVLHQETLMFHPPVSLEVGPTNIKFITNFTMMSYSFMMAEYMLLQIIFLSEVSHTSHN